MVPTHPHAEAQPTTRQQIHIGRLPRYQRCLTLRKYKDPGGEFEALSDSGQIAEHHEGIVERVMLVVAAGKRRRSVSMLGAEHVIVGNEVIEAHLFHRHAERPDSGWVAPQFVLRVHSAELH